MEIGKAEEIVSLYIKEHLPGPLTPEALDFRKALMLSSEALNCIQKIRYYPFPEEVLLLPGETKVD